MKKRPIIALILSLCVAAVSTILSATPAFVQPAAIPPSPPELFTPIQPAISRSLSTTKDPTIIRQRWVKANFDLQTRTQGEVILLNLFDDLSYNVVIEHQQAPSEKRASGGTSLVQFGKIVDIPDSEVYLASRGKSLSGNIRLPDGTLYEIRYMNSGVHSVRQVDETAFPPDHSPGTFEAIENESTESILTTPELFQEEIATQGKTVPTPSKILSDNSTLPDNSNPVPDSGILQQDELEAIAPTIPDDPLLEQDDSSIPLNPEDALLASHLSENWGSTINVKETDNDSVLTVMVVYTAAALAEAGNVDAMNSLIDLAEVETNQGFANSDINRRVRIVHRQTVDYPESGNSSTDLGRLVNPSDGFLDTIHALRQLYNADAVSLWVSNLNGCGLSRLMKSASLAFQDQAFSVVKLSCATGYYSFAHELGHNLGATHDVENSKSGLYSYSHGYQDPEGEFRTIMAYKCPGGCKRRNYWSNPNHKFNGKPLGVLEKADNVRTLSTTLPIATAWDNPGFRGQCFAQQVYWQGSYFPKTWIQELGNKGYLLTNLAQQHNESVVVMSKPLEYDQQQWVTHHRFPNPWIHCQWNENRYITDVGSLNSRWAVVMSKPVSYTRQLWAISQNFPQNWIKQAWSQDRRITTVGAKKNRWVVVTSSPSQYKVQRWVTSQDFPKEWVRQGWKKKSKITSVAATSKQFALVMSNPTVYDKQTWRASRNFPSSWITENQNKGYQITSLAATEDRWAVVMSTCK